jgi:hypothetical protein
MKDLRMSIIYDFEGDEGDFDDKRRYARPVLDGDNENHYGFGYCYEYDDFHDTDEYDYYHDFDSYFRLIERFPAFQQLKDRGEWVGDDVIYF